MNKEGTFLLKNFIELVIAAIGIVFIIILGVSLFNFYVNQDTKNAQKSLDSLMGKINALEDGENNTFLIRGVKGWSIVSYSKAQFPKPDKCFFESCVCICRSYSLEDKLDTFTGKGQADLCQNEGFCRKLDKDEVKVKQARICKSTTRVAGPYAGQVDTTCHYKGLEDKLNTIKVSKEDTSLLLEFL